MVSRCSCRAFTELSEVSRPESPQDNYLADICVRAALKGLRRVRKNETQTNLMCNPLNTGVALLLTTPFMFPILPLPKLLLNITPLYQLFFTKIQTEHALDLDRDLYFLQNICGTPLKKLIGVLHCVM